MSAKAGNIQCLRVTPERTGDFVRLFGERGACAGVRAQTKQNSKYRLK